MPLSEREDRCVDWARPMFGRGNTGHCTQVI